ncbi:hypothetical protein F2P81_023957 [Scophthalmus maximus]|uniref:Uncharacterized protein n=1 Tax=Scophthalmus maximus TaxID=52904 RepID=A0A6A4RSQ5_SCOMX|nr:hypothetical protein F2P81_023957 [Scophthalmus maximus]
MEINQRRKRGRQSFNKDTGTLVGSVWSARRLNDTTLHSANLGRPYDQLAAAHGRRCGVDAKRLVLTRCASQQRDEGVDEVGAATRWENSAEEKGRVEQWERENFAGPLYELFKHIARIWAIVKLQTEKSRVKIRKDIEYGLFDIVAALKQ